MSTDYTYDEQGEFFPFFVLTIGLLVSIPTTWSALKPSKELENTAPRIPTEFRPEHEDLIIKQRWKQKRKQRKLKRMIIAIFGWFVVGAMVYLMTVTTRSKPKIWDPYDILGLSTSSSESQIRKHYKKLSLIEHPDKRRPDPSKNETLESVNDHWVELVKAFKTLTDEDIRNNYIQYGHPDGKQSFSIGIALPQFIVQEGNGKYILLLYGMLLGVLLPLFVGRWWYGTQSKTRDGILVDSASNLFTEYKDDMNENAVIGALSSGVEFEDILQDKKGDDNSTKLEARIMKADDACKRLSKSDRERLLNMDDEKRRMALGLLWAYLHRVELNDPILDEQKYEVAPIAFRLNESLQTMSLAYGNVAPLLASYNAAQHLIQALPPSASPLQQLPFFTPTVVRAIKSRSPPSTDPTRSIEAFMSLPDSRRRGLVQTSDLLSSSEYNIAMSVASQLPLAHIESAFFKVVGERCVTAGSLINFVIKLRIIPPGTDPFLIPPVKPSDLEDPDPKEGDLDALHGRKRKGNDGKGSSASNQNDDDRVQPPLAHAPYYAREYSPRWRVFLADHKTGKIAVPPFTFSTFDNPIFEEYSSPSAPSTPMTPNTPSAAQVKKRRHSSISSSKKFLPENPKPTCAVQTLRMQFQAPPQVGKYPFVMHLVCDSYCGLDRTKEVVMEVEEVSKAEEMERKAIEEREEDDISEPEEDSLAGQMNALRGSTTGDGAKKKRLKSKAPIQEDEDDDDDDSSNTEGEDSDDDSDTDTDTDTDED